MARKRVYQPGARVLVLGLTFKENCPDLRNTRVIDLVRALEDFQLEVDVHDPWADSKEALSTYALDLTDEPDHGVYAAVVHAVSHRAFRGMQDRLREHLIEDGVLYDVRSTLDREWIDGRL